MGRNMSKLISKKSIINYFAELTVIVFGITIAFFVDDWAENRREERYEIEFLENIHDELSLNIKLFHDWKDYYKELDALFEEFYELQMNGDSSRSAAIKLREILVQTHSVNVFSSAWETTKSSGSLRIIKDSKLKNQISALYSRWFTRTERVYARLDNFKSTELISYYNQHRAGRDPSFTDLKALQAPQLYNIVRTYHIYHSFLKSKIIDSEEKTEKVIKLIEEYTNKFKRD